MELRLDEDGLGCGREGGCVRDEQNASLSFPVSSTSFVPACVKLLRGAPPSGHRS